jgi:hypothetical protein
MKEEQQIRIRAEFGVEGRRIRVERDRTRVRVFGLVALNRSWHPIYIWWRSLAIVGLVKSIFESSNRIRSIQTDLTGVSQFRNLKTSKSHNFLIQSLIWANKIWKLIYSMRLT